MHFDYKNENLRKLIKSSELRFRCNNLTHNFTLNYEKILEVLHSFSSENILRYQRRSLKLRRIKVFSICRKEEKMRIYSENNLFRTLTDLLKVNIQPSVYNRRKSELLLYL